MRTWIRQDETDRGERSDRPTAAEAEELRRLRKENLELRRGQRDPSSGERPFRPEDRPDPATVMTFVTEHRALFGVELVLRVLEIPVSTFYGWLAQQRDPCQRHRDDQALTNRIRRIRDRSGQTYGAPRIHAQLRRDGVRVSRKRVERLMRAHGLQGAFLRKRWRCSARQDPKATPALDLLNRDFTPSTSNRPWVADIERIPTGEGPLWLACVRDAFWRQIVGWKASDRADRAGPLNSGPFVSGEVSGPRPRRGRSPSDARAGQCT
jgi:putative transposase